MLFNKRTERPLLPESLTRSSLILYICSCFIFSLFLSFVINTYLVSFHSFGNWKLKTYVSFTSIYAIASHKSLEALFTDFHAERKTKHMFLSFVGDEDD